MYVYFVQCMEMKDRERLDDLCTTDIASSEVHVLYMCM